MKFIYHDTVGSTQDEARALYEQGVRETCWVCADRQTAGRGRLARQWDSPSGNFHATCLLPCALDPREAALIGFAVAVAVAETLSAYRPVKPITLKWPNDVLADGAKIAGILVEREEDALLIGVGINLVYHPDGLPYPATHLTEIMAPDDLSGPEPLFTGPDTLLAVLANEVDIWVSHTLHDGFERVRATWRERAHHLGKVVTVNGETGNFTDLAEDGALCLTREDGTQVRVHAGDVSFG